MEIEVEELVDYSSPTTIDDAQFELSLERSSIAKQSVKPVESITENCLICLEDVDSINMFEIGRCRHRFCSPCMQKHVEIKVKARELPKCPQLDCMLDLNITVCRRFLKSETYDVMDQLIKESSIPVTEKVYCPNPRCSNLMSMADALKNALSVEDTSKVEFTTCMCLKCNILFCIKCKVPWHAYMSCDYYRTCKLNLSSGDEKLTLLARDEKWRNCPRCNHLVELAGGCNHITCRCKHEFCYLCGREWKNKKATCNCVFWYEENIIGYGAANIQ